MQLSLIQGCQVRTQVVKVNAPAWRLRGQGGGISDRGLEVVHAVGIRYLLLFYIYNLVDFSKLCAERIRTRYQLFMTFFAVSRRGGPGCFVQ
jgi:hypothetical protein